MTTHHPGALVAKGQALQKAGRLAESIQCYLEATRVQPTAQAYWHLICAQMDIKQLEPAYKNCKDAIRLYPNEAPFYQVFARLKARLGHPDQAREVLRGATDRFPANAEVAIEYADSLIRAHQFAQAVPALERVIALRPSADLYRALSKMKRLSGDPQGAQQAVLEGRERFPLDVALAVDCTRFDQAAAARSQEAMRAALPTLDKEPAARSRILRHLAETGASATRATRNVPLEGAADWADLVKWADTEGLAAYISSLESELAGSAPRRDAAMERAYAAVAQMDWDGAEFWFGRIRQSPTHSVVDVTTFDMEFFSRLERTPDAEIVAPFGPITEVSGRTSWSKTMVYLACDPKYFELFVPRFLDSFVHQGTDAGVHVHIMDGTAEDWARLAAVLQRYVTLKTSMTAEAGIRERYGAFARNYFHAARYVRFYQYLRSCPVPAWMMDVDLVIEADPQPMFDVLRDKDFAATSCAVSLEPWTKFRAGLVGIGPTATGARYLRLVAAYISHWCGKGGLQWGIDQQALFGCYYYLQRLGHPPKTAFLNETHMNDRDGMPCIVRPVTDATRWEKNK